MANEIAVLLDDPFDSLFLGELGAIVLQMENDFCSTLNPLGLVYFIQAISRRVPLVRLFAWQIGLREDLDAIRNHEGRVESNTELADHVVVLGVAIGSFA